jgi:predicted Rossmann fold flavoprotein
MHGGIPMPHKIPFHSNGSAFAEITREGPFFTLNMNTSDIIYDVIVIGGGPAGMMAAGRAAERGARVLVLEKNESLGQKLLITGGGRCNLTNVSPDFLEKFKRDKKFLFSPFARYGVDETLRFFNERKVATKVEDGGRVFPESNRSQSVWDALERYMNEGSVQIRFGVFVKGFETEGSTVIGLRIGNDEVLHAAAYILATGGLSHPETGSTGDGFHFLKDMGHTVRNPEPSLVPIKVRERWVHALSGATLDDATLVAYQDGAKRFVRRGRMLFTHFGLSGPLVLNMSREVKELMKQGSVELVLDLAPGTDQGTLDAKIQAVFADYQNKLIKNALSGIIPSMLTGTVLGFAGVDQEKPVRTISREERLAIGRAIRHLPMMVSGFLGAEKAIITSGGVSLKEVNMKTMCSRKYSNLYLIGDILDIDRPSGGYSLQLCWTTGYIAGEAAAGRAKEKSA